MSLFDKFDQVTDNTAKKQEGDEAYNPSTTYIGPIRVDLLEEITPSLKWDVSSHPISGDMDISDNRIKLQDMLTLRVLLSDDETAGGTDRVGKLSDTPRSWEDKKSELFDFAKQDQTIEIVTPFDVYPSMTITSIDPQPSVDVSNGVVLVLSFLELKISKADLVNIDPSMIPKKRKRKKSSAVGEEGTEDAKKGVKKRSVGSKGTDKKINDDKTKSWLSSITDWIS